MKILAEYFIERPFLVNLIVIAVLVAGIQSISRMKKEGFPSVAQNRISIRTIYPGSSVEDAEINVSSKIEEAMEEVSGIKEVLSTSKEGASIVTVIADDDATPKQFDQIYSDVESAIQSIDDFPQLEGPPILSRWTSDDLPVIELALSGSVKVLKGFIPFLKEEIRAISEVSSVKVVGFPDDEIHILVDPKKAARKSIGLKMIARAIQERNTEGFGGTLESFQSEKRVVSYTKYKKPEEVLETNLRKTVGGGVKLKEVATIERAQKDEKLNVRNGGAPGVSLLVLKKTTADTLRTVDKIKELIGKLTVPEGIIITTLNDQSYLTRNRLKLLGGNALIGLLLVILVLYFTFGLKTAVWTAFGIPFSLLGLFALLPLFNVTLNALTLGGCVIVLGMLVDDAIVVSDQINKNKEAGMKGVEAAIEGVTRMWRPITAASITTVVAFSPLTQMGGLPGKFVWIIPLIVILALSVSLFESFFVLPSHLSHGRAVSTVKKPFIVKLERFYENILKKSIKRKKSVILFFGCILIGTIFIAKNFMKKDPFPQDGAEGFFITVTQPIGVSFLKAEQLIRKVETELNQLPQKELEGFSVRMGTHSLSQVTERGTQTNLATIFVYLTPYANRSRSAAEIISELRAKLAIGLGEGDSLNYDVKRIGPPVGKAFEVRISSNDSSLRKAKGEEVKKFLSGIQGVSDLQDDELEGKEELNLIINYDLLSEAELTVSDIVKVIRIGFEGQIITKISNLDGTLDFRLRLNKAARAKENFLQSLPILNKRGNLSPIERFISLEKRKSLAEMKHINGRRTTTVFGTLDKKRISPNQIETLVKEKFDSTHELVISFAGESVENRKIFANLGSAGLIAVLGVFGVIALLFNSLVRPLIVVVAIPFGIVGIVFALLAHGMPISMFSMISLIGLTGIAVNDSIVMVDTINRLVVEKGCDDVQILNGAVSRLRPILLTTLTTVLGIFPTAYGIGGSDIFISPMCLAMAYGLMFSTIVILFLVPCIYSAAFSKPVLVPQDV